MLCEHSIHKINRNSVFISSVQKYSSKISFYSFAEKKTFFFEKPLGVVNIYLLKMSVMETTVDFTNVFPFTEVVLSLQTLIDKTLSEKKTRILVIVKP